MEQALAVGGGAPGAVYERTFRNDGQLVASLDVALMRRKKPSTSTSVAVATIAVVPELEGVWRRRARVQSGDERKKRARARVYVCVRVEPVVGAPWCSTARGGRELTSY